MTVAPSEKDYAFFARGELREDMLASWRNSLRLLVDPATGQPFSETEIATATAQGSRWWIEANAIDLVLQAKQANGLLLADQVRIDRANTEWLRGYHGPLWIPEGALPASGGSGPMSAPAPAGTTFLGSTTVPDVAATYFTDPAGLRYQVLYTVVTPGSGVAELVVKAVDTGTQTNIKAGTILKNANGPIAFVQGTADEDFRGGTPAESDAQYARRIIQRVRHKQGAGNNAQIRGWAEDASNSVEAAFVYACAFHSGSVLVAITQKRSTTKGPLGRIPSVGTMATVVGQITPPGSPVMPTPPNVLAIPVVPQFVEFTLQLAMPKGRSSGWTDLTPWPTTNNAGGFCIVSGFTSPTQFRITIPAGSAALPAGVTRPALMAFDTITSRWERLNVQSVTLFSPGVYDVVLSAAPVMTMGTTVVISPDTARRDVIAQTVEAYMDSLGPGEVVDLATDSRAHRAARFPVPAEEFPQRFGTSVENYLQDALGSSLYSSDLPYQNDTVPAVPGDPAVGPNLFVTGRVGVYSL